MARWAVITVTKISLFWRIIVGIKKALIKPFHVYGFIKTGNADLAFAALSQICDESVSYWRVPDHYHAQISQDAILLGRSADKIEANAFMLFLQSPEAQNIINNSGYEIAPS